MKKLSTLFIGMTLSCAAFAQTIPNAGFENWTNHTTYDTPDGWATADSALDALVGGGLHTCDKSTPGATGSGTYIKLTSVTVPILGVLPGIAASGKLNVSGTTVTPSGGFTITSRPANLTGSWKFAPSGSDQGSITILLTKWNGTTRDTIAYTNRVLTGSVSSWTAFSIPLTYQRTTAPDSGIIVLLSGKATGGTAGSTISIDDLAFTGTVPSNVVTINNNTSEMSIFPNPASVSANISYNSGTNGDVKINVTDINGRTIKEIESKKVRGTNNFQLDVNGLAHGVYFVKISDDLGVSVRKLIVE